MHHITLPRTNALKPKAICLACALALTLISSVQAASNEESIHEIDKVTVEDAVEENGKTILLAPELETLPLGTDSVTDALRGESFIQFSSNSRVGSLGAEITPAQISIRGSRNYENSFLINGLNNNNNLSPTGYESFVGSMADIDSADAQGIMLDTDLLKSITVLSENISAEYGDFTGGVINAEIRDARIDRWHTKFSVRHTRDSWAQFHLTSAEKANDHPSSADSLQKEFQKTDLGLVLEGPLFEGKLGAMISYQKTYSRTPAYTKTGSEWTRNKAKREKDNFMLRLNTDEKNDFYIASSIMYSPYEATFFESDNKNGKYSSEGGGWNFNLNSRANLSFGKWKNDFSYSQTEMSRTSGSNLRYWWQTVNPSTGEHSGYVDWTDDTDAFEGLYGDIENTQISANFKSTLDFDEFATGNVKHNLLTGIQVSYTKVKSESTGRTLYKWNQREANKYPNNNQFDSNIRGDFSDGVISGEQWLNQKSITPSYNTTQDYLSAAFFLEDEMAVERVTLRPGVRISYDDVTSQTNIAPRISFDIDVLNDRRFSIDGGFNRYYGTEVLTYAIKTDVSSSDSFRHIDADGNLTDWSKPENKDSSYYGLNNLDTPYSDEYVIGGSANIFNGTIIRLQGVYRDYKDQLMSEQSTRDGYEYELTNGGQSKYKGISLTVEKDFDFGKFGKHRSSLGITNSKLEGNYLEVDKPWQESGDKGMQGFMNPQYIYLDGEKTAVSDLPANNFNSEWVITYTHNASFFDNRLRSSVWMRWESATDPIMELTFADGDFNPVFGDDGQMYRRFETEHNGHTFYTDAMVAYDLIKTANSTLTVNLEVLNLFNNDNKSSYWGNTSYSMGRQFYLGMTYNY